MSIAAFGGGDAVPTAEGKRGQDTKHGFLSPLDSPNLPLSRRIEDARLNGGTGARFRALFCLWDSCYALNLLCVICRA